LFLWGIKIKVPVRNNDCKHLEAFELTTIFRKIKEAEGNPDLLYEGCPVKDCKATFIWKIESVKSNFGLDLDLFNAIKKGYSFSTEFNIK
jgi:hypothetical protein